MGSNSKAPEKCTKSASKVQQKGSFESRPIAKCHKTRSKNVAKVPNVLWAVFRHLSVKGV